MSGLLERWKERPRYPHVPGFVVFCMTGYYFLAAVLFYPEFVRRLHRGEHIPHSVSVTVGGASFEVGWLALQKALTYSLVPLTMYSFFVCVHCDVSVPSDAVASDLMEAGRERCAKCTLQRPDRAHHCKRCMVCVDRYDHHCDWIDNCVGRDNHKAFVLFLLYITLTIFHYWYLLFWYLRTSKASSAEDIGYTGVTLADVYTTCVLCAYTLCVLPMTPFATCFLGWTLFLVTRNTTTYDHTSKDHRHDKGLLCNVQEVMGRNPLLWLVPPVALAA